MEQSKFFLNKKMQAFCVISIMVFLAVCLFFAWTSWQNVQIRQQEVVTRSMQHNELVRLCFNVLTIAGFSVEESLDALYKEQSLEKLARK